jgi:hypothetical protein
MGNVAGPLNGDIVAPRLFDRPPYGVNKTSVGLMDYPQPRVCVRINPLANAWIGAPIVD